MNDAHESTTSLSLDVANTAYPQTTQPAKVPVATFAQSAELGASIDQLHQEQQESQRRETERLAQKGAIRDGD